MSIPFTVVLGIDNKTIKQLHMTLPTWKKNKPSLFENPFVVFYDRRQIQSIDVKELFAVCVGECKRLYLEPWPPIGTDPWNGDPADKWTNPQRQKMLSGFIHVASAFVNTEYWLKIDTDAVAMGQDDWIKEEWFDDDPVFVGSSWGYTKPPNQMLMLDQWVRDNHKVLPISLITKPPLNMIPEPGSDLLSHKRLASWCSFFRTDFTCLISNACFNSCGLAKMPVPSQDGVFWYMTERMQKPHKYVNMKKHGWDYRSTQKGLEGKVRDALVDNGVVIV